MKKIIFLSITIILLATACNSKKKTAKTTYNNFYNVADTTVVISQTKGYCFGTCPVYKLKIRANGTLELKAIDNLKLQNGDYTTTIPQSEIEALYAIALEVNYFGMQNEYDDQYIQDVPATYISLMNNDTKQIKHIKDRWKAPAELKTLENAIHKLVEQLEWQSVISN